MLMLAASLIAVSAFMPAAAPLRVQLAHPVASAQVSPVAISMFGGSRSAKPAVKTVKPAAKKVVKAVPKKVVSKVVKKVVKKAVKTPVVKAAAKPAATSSPSSPFAGLFGSKPSGTAPKKAVKKVVAKRPVVKPAAKPVAKKPVAKPVVKKPVVKPVVKKPVTRVAAAKKPSPSSSTYSGGRNAKWDPFWRSSSPVAQKPKPRAAPGLVSSPDAMKRAEAQRKAYEARVASERALKGKASAPPARSIAASTSKRPVSFSGNGVPLRAAPPKPKPKPRPPPKSYLSKAPARKRSSSATAGSSQVDAGPLIAVGLLAVVVGAIFNNPAPPPPKPEFPLVPLLALGSLGAGAALVLGGGGGSDDAVAKPSASSGVVEPVAIATEAPVAPEAPEAPEAEKAEAEPTPVA